MLRWFHALMPKEERFFELFAQHSHAVIAGAVALRAMLEGGDAIGGVSADELVELLNESLSQPA